MDLFLLSEDGILYYLERRHESRLLMDEYLNLKLIVRTTLIDKILVNCHDSVEGGYQEIEGGFIDLSPTFAGPDPSPT